MVWDCCMNPEPANLAKKDHEFKLFISQLAIEWIEEKHKVRLSRGKCLLNTRYFFSKNAQQRKIDTTYNSEKKKSIDF